MKTIKLTNEMAVALYKKDPELRTTLLHEFTDEELGIKPKPLRWEDLGQLEGCYITPDANIFTLGAWDSDDDNKNIYPCVKDAEKALAHCQLLQLAKHYNKCDQHEIEGAKWQAVHGDNIITANIADGTFKYGSEVFFIYPTDLNKCIEDNRDLWEIYLGVK